MNTPTPQSRVSRITVGRLHNLGNYEHVRYEITVDVQEGASATAAMADIENVLAALDPKPPVEEHNLQRAVEGLKKPAAEMQEWELSNIQGWKDMVAAHKAWSAGRKVALGHLDAIGGKVSYVDAKDTWDTEI